MQNNWVRLINYHQNLTQLAAKGTLPEGLVEPNSETLQAIYELENGIGVSHYNNVEELSRLRLVICSRLRFQ